jgi:hypothetical protein
MPKIRRVPKSRRPYCLGSAESPAADFLLDWLKSSRSDPCRYVASLSCRPQVPCPSLVMAYIQTSDQSGASIAEAPGFPREGGGWQGGGGRGVGEGGEGGRELNPLENRSHLPPIKLEGEGDHNKGAEGLGLGLPSLSR